MTTASPLPAALSDLRVLDLTEQGGQYAPKLLADLGADVLRVEPPAGAAVRRLPPFLDDDPHPDRSLTFWYWNTSKRSLTLDLTTADGRALFRRLLPSYDVLVHSFTPAQAAPFGLDAADLAALHPGLIQCAITPFGSWGPHADYLGGEIVLAAMAGPLWLAGYPDRPPTLPPGEQAAVCAAIQAAQAILIALFARDASGEGQTIDVSQQEALSMTQETAMQYWDLRRELRRRTGGGPRVLPGIGTYACADGHIYAMVGASAGAGMGALVAWLAEEGLAGDLTEPDWQAFLPHVNNRELPALRLDPEKLKEIAPKLDRLDELISAFFLSKPKRELYEEGQRRRLLIGPVNSTRDLAENEQLQARGWWQEIEHPELGRTVTYPGAPYHHAVTPWRISRRPPLLGEHTLEVLAGELGLTRAQTQMLMSAGVI